VQKPCTEPEPTATAVSSPANTATAVTTPTQTATAVSEPPFPGWQTFVVENRRQTDQLPRQMYAILPNEIKRKWSFYSCWTKAPPTENAVLFAAYGGFPEEAYSDPAQKDEIARRHQETRDCMESAFKANPKQKIKISFVIGDSPTPGFVQKLIRDDLQPKQNLVTKKYGQVSVPIGFGYDELAVTSMAYALGNVDADVIISNPEARMHYEGSEQIKNLIGLKLAEIGITNKPGAELKILVLTRRPGADNLDFQANDELQHKFDAVFLAKNTITETTAIIDARLYNGAWDTKILPKTCDYLAVGAWGTSNNVIGSTASIAKILLRASKETRKQLLLEAISHDFFFQGYEEVQRNNYIHNQFKSQGLTYSHYGDYSSTDLVKAYKIINEYANKRMNEHFAGTDCFSGKKVTLTPQRPKLFEAISEVN
jgi:hypothetical protein